ncbi:MAG TPA: ATP-binding cassette domain-containing protein [Planctomycetota bacterium]|nr:ATP-binding cassette domain-containing protein [Planctomycetota bacterium]
MSRLDVSELVKTLGEGGIDDASAVLRGVTFSIDAGECLGLKGATGAGKSTLLRIIAGLLQPDSGEVRIDGEIVSSRTVHVPPQTRGVGLVFQNLGLWPHLTVKGHLDYVLSASTPSKADRLSRRDEIIDTFVLEGLQDRYPAQLSGGERHLLAMARAFCGNIRLLLLDEPFTGLDGALKARVFDTLRRERARRRLTTLLVTHDNDEMKGFCDRIEHLNEGRIMERLVKSGG